MFCTISILPLFQFSQFTLLPTFMSEFFFILLQQYISSLLSVIWRFLNFLIHHSLLKLYLLHNYQAQSPHISLVQNLFGNSHIFRSRCIPVFFFIWLLFKLVYDIFLISSLSTIPHHQNFNFFWRFFLMVPLKGVYWIYAIKYRIYILSRVVPCTRQILVKYFPHISTSTHKIIFNYFFDSVWTLRFSSHVLY